MYKTVYSSYSSSHVLLLASFSVIPCSPQHMPRPQLVVLYFPCCTPRPFLVFQCFDNAQQKHGHIDNVSNFPAAVGRHNACLDRLINHTIAAFPHQHYCGDECSTHKSLGKAHLKERALPVPLCLCGGWDAYVWIARVCFSVLHVISIQKVCLQTMPYVHKSHSI